MRKTLTLILSALCLFCSGCAFINLDLAELMQFPDLEERTLRDGNADKFLVVEILGTINTTAMRDSFMPREGTVERLDMVLTRAAGEKNLRGILLKIDSPGGGVTASDLIYRRIQQFKDETGVPVVACIVGQGTSGAYMASLSADRIVALPSALVGNVGVIMPSISVEGLLDKLGVDDQTVKSGQFKDVGSPLKDMSPDDRAILSGIIMEQYQDFLSKVEANRPVTGADIELIGDGRVFSARQAQSHHLVDQVGYYEDALTLLERLSDAPGATVVLYRQQGEHGGGFYSWP